MFASIREPGFSIARFSEDLLSDDAKEKERIEKSFIEQVKVPTQVAAEVAAFTRPADWFKDCPVPPSGDEDANDFDDAHFDGSLLPALSLHRFDGATLHIGLTPSDDEGIRDIQPPCQETNCVTVDITGYIRLPNQDKPIGIIKAHAVKRDPRCFRNTSDFFSACNEISERFVNAVITFCAVGGDAGLPGAPIKDSLKLPPHEIPTSCDVGPLVVVESITVIPQHRGSELGMDALVVFLRSFRWSIAFADIAPLNEHGGDGSPVGNAPARLARLRRYFERVHFKHGVTGGHPRRSEAAQEEARGSSRFHWLARDRFDRGHFDIVQYRLFAAKQRLALAGCLNNRLSEISPAREEMLTKDLHEKCIEGVALPIAKVVARSLQI
eukprot:SAG31_NODE_2031_length_6627_cov_1.575368_4_plen_382_part_00